MQYQISSSMASFCKTMPLPQAMRMIKDAGFDALDFPFSVYAYGENAPLLQADWRDWVRQVRDLSRELSLPIAQAHAAWEQGIGERFRYEPPHELYERTLEACGMVGCGHLIFHPLRRPDRVDTESLRGRIHDYNVRWFHSLVPAAQENKVTIDLENTFDSHHTQLPGDLPYPYVTAQDMLSLQRDIASPYVKLCLDTGHANISAQDIPAMIYTFGRELSTLHLNDNYGHIGPIYEDLHLFPGSGKIEWEPIFTALRSVGYCGVLNIEPVAELRRASNRVRAILLRAAADTLRAMLEG